MNDIVIKAENLGKLYRIGSAEDRDKTFREALVGMVAAPFRRIRHAFSPPVSNDVNPSEFIWALKDVNFKVKQGEIVGIIGRNGAGKSTLLKILARITEPTEGKVTLRGRVGSLLEIGTGFHSELTGEENIYLSGTILGMSSHEISRKFDEIVAFAEMEKFIHTPVKYYSSGMYMRLAFAVAAHLEPEILLVDEVLAVGDAAFQGKCLGKMGAVAKQGRTVLFVSHSMAHVTTICSRAILLESGSVAMEGTPREAIDCYLNSTISIDFPTWDSPETGPGMGNLRLHTVRVLQDNRPCNEVDISKDTLIEIQFWNLKAGSRLQSGMHLLNGLQVCIFASHNWPENSLSADPWYNRPCPQGLFRSTCIIPANFLNNGYHTVSVFVADLNNVRANAIDAQLVVTFNAYDTGAMRSPDISGGDWTGIIRPKLSWFTEYLD